MAIQYRHEQAVAYGVALPVSPRIRRVVARNPSPFTYHGTSTFVVGRGRVALIDPGPQLGEHVDALLEQLRGEQITHVLVTHTHRDHSPAAALIAQRTGALRYGFGPHGQGRFEPGATVEAGADTAFDPDVRLAHGDIVEGDGWSLECVHTPGHCSNHLCYQLREESALFTGDHVMGWSTSVISPPDGDMGEYLSSLRLLLERDDRVLLPAHGPAIEDVKPFVGALIEHREGREAQVTACLRAGIEHIEEMVPRMYAGLAESLHPAAARSVFAHVVHMFERGLLECDRERPELRARYRLKN